MDRQPCSRRGNLISLLAGRVFLLWVKPPDPQPQPAGTDVPADQPCHPGMARNPSYCRFIPAHAGNIGQRAGNSDPFRFIPAGAGNILLTYTKLAKTTVHPRGCGEHCDCIAVYVSVCGSSPRVRGTFCSYQNTKLATTVHPRGCGEHIVIFMHHCHPIGSSPRVRGTWAQSVLSPMARRFIPAGAGNIRVCLVWFSSLSVHPRGCGEHDTNRC